MAGRCQPRLCGAELLIALRLGSLDDAEAAAGIYAHYALHSTATFDTEPLTAAEMRAKFQHILDRGWPLVMAQNGDAVVGYAYATQFRDRDGYRFSCEDSIYVREGRTGGGIGTLLLTRLIQEARAFGFRQMFAVIGGGEPGSVALHRRLDFREVGRMHNVGCKFGRWIDTVYMQLELTPPGEPPADGSSQASA